MPVSKPGLLSNWVVVPPPGVGVGVGVVPGVGVGVGVVPGVGVGVGVPPVIIGCERAQALVSFDQVACMA